MTVISPEAIRDAEERIREMTEDIAIANEELATAKKLAKRKFETAIKRAQNAYDKAVAKSNPDNLSMFNEADEAVKAAKEKLEGVLADAKASENAANRLPSLMEDVAKKKIR